MRHVSVLILREGEVSEMLGDDMPLVHGSVVRSVVRVPRQYDSDQSSLDSSVSFFGKTLTQQQFRDECDINEIVRRFGLTGQLPENLRAPQYGDFTGVSDYQTALNAVIAADEAFMELPANVRERFDNDPAKFVDFCSDDANRAEAERLGLVFPKEKAGEDAVKAPEAPLEE